MNLRVRNGIIAAALLGIFIAAHAFAQDRNEPQTQGDDAVYISVTFVKYKPGKRGEAFQIIDEHFRVAGENAGIPGPRAIHFQTGKWDAAFHWKLEGGMADLEWFISPDNVKWWAALVEHAGSEEEAQALWDRYIGLVATAQTEVGHYHDPEKSDE